MEYHFAGKKLQKIIKLKLSKWVNSSLGVSKISKYDLKAPLTVFFFR